MYFRPYLTLRLVSGGVFFLFGFIVYHPPFFVTVFSDRFSEGALKNLRDGFPPDEEPYTDSYEYFSDSDLDDEDSEGYAEASKPPIDNTAASDHDLLQRNSTRGAAAAIDQESAQARGTPPPTTDQNKAERTVSTTGDSGGRPETTNTTREGGDYNVSFRSPAHPTQLKVQPVQPHFSSASRLCCTPCAREKSMRKGVPKLASPLAITPPPTLTSRNTTTLAKLRQPQTRNPPKLEGLHHLPPAKIRPSEQPPRLVTQVAVLERLTYSQGGWRSSGIWRLQREVPFSTTLSN